MDFQYLFFIAGIASLVAAGCFYLARPEFKEFPKNETHWKTFSLIIKSMALYPLIMVFLGACAFTIMVNFQSTYANSIGMNYSSFYLIYSLSVVLSRLLLGKRLSQYNQYKVAIVLLILMVISLTSFLFSSDSVLLYCISSALFGISYGLVYPTIQAIAVNVTQPNHRADVITFFSLSYFIGVYAFPPIAGLAIVAFGYTSVIIIISTLAFIELILALVLLKLSIFSINPESLYTKKDLQSAE
ncbi:MFS transporter [Fastidiosibacter lacustris]|uniref:MFS transporter n=1 Tax=Fastidiosibacter lacustris TaxID=2056695 RepID=UPI000E34E635|nr:MFS transporter [Fastidiosibacter lacustris]